MQLHSDHLGAHTNWLALAAPHAEPKHIQSLVGIVQMQQVPESLAHVT